MMKTNRVIVSLLMMILISETALAQEGDVKSLELSQVALLAKRAVDDEVAEFNSSLTTRGYVEGYSPNLTQYMINSGKARIDPSFMLEKCTLSNENIAAIFSSTLSDEDDALEARKNGLAAIKTTYDGKVWRLLSQVCSRARTRFVNRMDVATENGVALNFSEQVIGETAKVLFYPTDFGRATARKAIAQAFNFLLNGALTIGAGGMLMGIPVGGVILSVVTTVNGARAVGQQLHHHNPFGTRLDSEGLSHLQGIKIDMEPEMFVSE